MSRMQNWLTKRAELTPHRLALTYQGQTWTFRQLRHSVLDRAGRFAAAGFPANRRIALLSPNSADFYLWLLACQQLDVEMVLLNARLAPTELDYQLRDAGISLLFFEPSQCPVVERVRELNPGIRAVSFEDMAAASAPPTGDTPVVSEFDLDRVTTIMYTSGTTGEPKGVQQTLGNHWWSAIGSVLNLGLEPALDSWVCVVPLFHISGFSIMMRSLIYGIPVHLHRRFDAAAVNADLLQGRGTTVSVVAYTLQALLDDLGDRQYPASLRCLLLGGGFVDRVLLERCRAAGVPVIQSYGMTETASQIVALNVADAQRKIGSAGQALMPVQLRIGQGSPAGTIGEIQVKSPTLTVGYLNKNELFRDAWTADGWFRTGDSGYLDDEGFLFVKSRLTEMIISGGENIFPSEIEQCLRQRDDIAEAAVVGRPDPLWGAVPVAFLVAATPARPSDSLLTEYCRERLAHYKVPTRFHWVDVLPRTALGKVRKSELPGSTASNVSDREV